MDESAQVSATKLIAWFDLGFNSISARLIFGAVFLAFAAHLALFLTSVPQTQLEQSLLSEEATSSFYTILLQGLGDLTGSPLYAGRILSACCALATLVLVARYGKRISDDEICGTTLPLGFVLFPPLAFIFSQATPHAVLALFCIAVVVLVDRLRQSGSSITRLMVGLVCAVLIAVGLAVLPNTPATRLPGSTSLAAAILQPYAMLWAALGFSLLALIGSKALRNVLMPSGVRHAVMRLGIFALALGWVFFVSGNDPQNLGITFSSVFVFGLLAVLPMVMWIRMVMPRLRSILVWILLPVVMYSCFWVILWPIDLDGFPYDQLELDAGLSWF